MIRRAGEPEASPKPLGLFPCRQPGRCEVPSCRARAGAFAAFLYRGRALVLTVCLPHGLEADGFNFRRLVLAEPAPVLRADYGDPVGTVYRLGGARGSGIGGDC